MKHEKNLDWQATLDAIETTHNLTTRDICNMLKTGRTWITRYITSNPVLQESKIYLPNGRGASADGKKKFNWVYVAAQALGKTQDFTASNWYCRQDFENVLREAVYSVSRQTISVPVELFVDDKVKLIEEYRKLQKEIDDISLNFELKNRERVSELSKLFFKKENLWREMVADDKAPFVLAGDCTSKGRSKVPHTKCDIGDVVDLIGNWVAPHELKGYGGTDEQVCRTFFKEGYIRIELHLKGVTSESEAEPDEEGKKPRKEIISEKIYYIKDPYPIKHKYIEQYIPFSYEEWLRYKIVFKDKTKPLPF